MGSFVIFIIDESSLMNGVRECTRTASSMETIISISLSVAQHWKTFHVRTIEDNDIQMRIVDYIYNSYLFIIHTFDLKNVTGIEKKAHDLNSF